MRTKILCADAKIKDRRAIAKLMEPIPRHDEVLAQLRSGFVGRLTGYDTETRAGRFFLSDGKMVRCYTVIPISPEEVAAISLELNNINHYGAQTFVQVVERTLPGEFSPVN